MYRNFYTPDGVNDMIGSELLHKNTIEESLIRILVSNGFDPIETPTIEFMDVYLNERTEMPAQDMYKVLDRQGNVLVLKPDFTPAIARAVSHGMKGKPVKVFSKGRTFRYQNLYSGKDNESTEFDVECIGNSSIEADALMVTLAIESMLATGLRDFKIDLGDVNFFMGLMDETGIDYDTCKQIQIAIESRNKESLTSILEDINASDDLKNWIKRIPRLSGGLMVLRDLQEANLNGRSKEAVNRLIKVFQLVQDLGYSDYLTVDLSMVKRLNYYTGVLFRGMAEGVGKPILQGGRYDDLLGQFQNPMPAIGFGIDLMALLKSLQFKEGPGEPAQCDYLIGYNTDNFMIANRLRQKLIEDGKSVYMDEVTLLPKNKKGQLICSSQEMKTLLQA